MANFIDRAVIRLSGISHWHFVWMTLLLAEVFTLIANTIQSIIWWGYISVDLLLIGTVDAFFVSLFVSPVVIYFLKFTTTLRVEKEMYELQIIGMREIEEELRKARDEWEESFNIINDAITIHDRDFNILRANKAAEELIGLPLLTITRQKCHESYHGLTCPPDQCPSCETLKTGQPSTAEVFEKHLNRYLEIKALPRVDQKDGSIIGLIHVVRDITEQKKAQEAVRKTAEMTQDILERAPFGIYVINRQGTIEYVNPAMLAISGDKPIHFIGLNVFELPTYRELGIAEKLRKALEGEPFSVGPIEYTSHFGRKTTTRKFIGQPLGDETDRRVLVFVEDVTTLRMAEDEQKRLQQQLIQAQKMESIGRLAGGVAHDFNNILSAIIGYSEMAAQSLPEGDPVREYCSIIYDAGERAASLTQQLLAFSRKQVLEMKVVNVNGIVMGMMKILNHVIGEDIEITCVTRSPIRNVLADPVQIEQVLMNLAINARDAMPGGGKLRVETSEKEVDASHASLHKGLKTGSYVTLQVKDTGSGMERETREKIFEPFFTTKEQGKGTGLGLATVYGIVKQHNGYIAVESEQGRGSAFTVYLPAGQGTDALVEVTPAVTIPKGDETILVVEDEAVVRKMIVDIIRPVGYRILEAADGETALRQFNSLDSRLSLMLTDVVMPKMSGIELSKILRSRHPDLKVIFMSGYSGDAISSEILKEPGTVFLQKPVTAARLAEKLAEVMKSHPA